MADILVLGSGGQLGQALMASLGERAYGLAHTQIDFLDADFTAKLDALTQPFSAVINAVAYTQVDKAEGEGKQDAWRVNATAVEELAHWCKKHKLPLVHYSTDYVFDGSGDRPRTEEAAPAPLNAYGKSKLAGEQAIQKTGGDYLIFRTSWVYNATAKNFFTTMLRLIHEKESLQVVDDQIGAPTYAPHLAQASIAALERALTMPEFPSGLYHLCHAGAVSWCGFARAIFTLARRAESGQSSPVKCQHINPISSSAYPLPALRPLNSRLDCTKARERLAVALPKWEDGLVACMEEKYAGSRFTPFRPEDHPA